jgi:four helix bundle protein
MKNFRCYQLAKTQYQSIQKTKVPYHMRNQLDRASLSVCLNLAEGSAKQSQKDRARFYEIAMASHRETQAILELIGNRDLIRTADRLAGGLFNLIRALRPVP